MLLFSRVFCAIFCVLLEGQCHPFLASLTRLHGAGVRAFLSGPHGDKYAADAVDEKRSFINHPLT